MFSIFVSLLLTISSINGLTLEEESSIIEEIGDNNVLNKKILNKNKYPNSQCLDGTQGLYFEKQSLYNILKNDFNNTNCDDIYNIINNLQPGKTSKFTNSELVQKCKDQSNLFVVYLQGGGFCYTQETCLYQISRGACLGSSNNDKCNKKEGGRAIYSGNCDKNPDFCFANRIYIGYCSGDLFLGNLNNERTPFFNGDLPGFPPSDKSNVNTFKFQGANIIDSVFDVLIEQRSLDNIGNKVVFGGFSAGGAGVIYNIDRIANKLKKATIKGLSVSGLLFPKHNNNIFNGFNEKIIFYDLATMLNVYTLSSQGYNEAQVGNEIFNIGINDDGNNLISWKILLYTYLGIFNEIDANKYNIDQFRQNINSDIFYSEFIQDRLSISSGGGLSVNPLLNGINTVLTQTFGNLAVPFPIITDSLKTVGNIGISPDVSTTIEPYNYKYLTLGYIDYFSGQTYLSFLNEIQSFSRHNVGYFLVNCFNHSLGIEVGDNSITFMENKIGEPISIGLNKKPIGGINEEILINGKSVTKVFGDWFFTRNILEYPNGYIIYDPLLDKTDFPSMATTCPAWALSGFKAEALTRCNPTCNIPQNDEKFNQPPYV